VLNVQHLEQGGEELFSEFLLRDTAGDLSGGLASQGGLDGLPDGQSRQVDVVCTWTRKTTAISKLASSIINHPSSLTFLTVQDLSSVLLLHLLGRQPLVDDITLDILVTLSVVGDRLQERTRTTTRSGEDETHLTRLQETGKVGQEFLGFRRKGVDAEDLENTHDGHDELFHDGVGESSDVDL